MEVELHLEQLAVDLDRAAREARERTQREARHDGDALPNDAEHRRWLHTLLKEMSSVVDQTTHRNGAGNDRRLYVWPGYDSVRLQGGRVTFEVDHATRMMLTHLGYENGLSDGDNERALQTGVVFPQTDQRIDRTTLYFDAALAPLTERETSRNTTFSVGGTHNWLALNPMIGAEPLIGFEVRADGDLDGKNHSSFPTFAIDSQRPREWGDTLAEAINWRCGESDSSFWPLPARWPGEPYSSYRDRLQKEFGSAKHRDIRHRLYSLWLIGCFVEDPAPVLLEGKGRAWLDGLIRLLADVEPARARRIEGLREFERNVAQGGELPLNPACFTRWGVVTIPYPIADARVDACGSDDLGSGMLLSNFQVPYWYYFAIRQWIASYYLSLRQRENSFLMAERESHKAAMEAEKQLRRQLSHAVGTELTYIQFLASEALTRIAEDHFNPRESVLKAAVLEKYDSANDASFVRAHGKPTPFESNLVQIIEATAPTEHLSRDVTLIRATLAAVPSEEGRRIMAALASELKRAAIENRALVRVDEPGVVAVIERSCEPTGDANAMYLVDLLGHALLVAFTTYFQKAFPPDNEGSEIVCLRSAEVLFGTLGASLKERHEIARGCAQSWRQFVADEHVAENKTPSYAAIRAWLYRELLATSSLRLQLPEVDDYARIQPGCGEYAPLVAQAWLTEALLNALKHARPEAEGGLVIIKVSWLVDNALLEVSNTATDENARQVARAVDASAVAASSLTDGHQGLAFLGYAARHLFEGARLRSEFVNGQMLRLRVK